MSSYAKMWFGTEYKMQWIDCPLQGADVSPMGWSAEGTLLNGGGYAKHSWASHRNYVFEWRQSSARRMAQIMHNYRDGVYGRGLIHFVDPLTMDFNILPKQWAYPALMAGEANNPFLRGTALSTVATPTNTFNLPIQGAVVPLGSLSGFRATDSVFIPRPENKVLQLWGLYTTSGNATAGVYAIPVNDNGTNGTPVRLTPTALNGGTPAEYNLATGKGVRLCVMKTSSAEGVVNLFGLVGRLADAAGYRRYDWTGAVDNSTSTVSDSAGNAMLTNLVTNPRSVASGTMVEVWRNLSPNPLYAGAIMSGPHIGNPAIFTANRVTSLPVTHPLGITTGTEGGRVIGATAEPRNLAAWHQLESVSPAGLPGRYLGVWVMVTKPGYRPVAGSGSWPTAELPANQWVWIVAGNVIAAGAVTVLTIAKITGNAEEDARVYITGVHASETPLTGREPFYPGITSPDLDLTARWTGTANNSPSVLEGKAVRGVVSSNSVAVQSAWTPEGQSGSSIRVIPTSDTANAFAVISPSGVLPEVTAAVVVRLTAPQTGTIAVPGLARGIYWNGSNTPRSQAPNEAGEFPLTFVHPASGGYLFLYNGARLGGGDVWFYCPTVVNGEHPDLGPFHGSMPLEVPGSTPLTEWLGGQGNSGCRFVGSPTYIENTGVNGGQISYAASFKEVGDWQ